MRPIDANALQTAIAMYMAENAYLNDTALDVLKMVHKWADEAPTLYVAPVVHGYWKSCNNGGYFCSVCDHRVAFLVHNRYCPNCGAKMDGDGDE